MSHATARPNTADSRALTELSCAMSPNTPGIRLATSGSRCPACQINLFSGGGNNDPLPARSRSRGWLSATGVPIPADPGHRAVQRPPNWSQECWTPARRTCSSTDVRHHDTKREPAEVRSRRRDDLDQLTWNRHHFVRRSKEEALHTRAAAADVLRHRHHEARMSARRQPAPQRADRRGSADLLADGFAGAPVHPARSDDGQEPAGPRCSALRVMASPSPATGASTTSG